MREHLSAVLSLIASLLLAGFVAPAAAQTDERRAPSASQAAPRDGEQNPEERPDARLPVCSLAPDDPGKLAVEPCRPAPTHVERRAVEQVTGRMPARMPPPIHEFHPAPPVAPALPTNPDRPLPLIGCHSGVCRDAGGTLHNGGVGNATLDPNGKLCNREGVWLQCF